MRLALSIIFVFGLFLAGKLFYWQIIRWDELSQAATEERDRAKPLYAHRGDIETGDGVLLAKDVFRYEIRVSPQGIIDPEGLADKLAPILGTPRDAILAQLGSKAGSVVLAQDVPQAVAEQVQDLKAQDTRKFRKWIGLQVEGSPVRLYPAGSFAAHVVGYVNLERKSEHGVEQFKDGDLRGTDGTLSGATNALHTDLIPFDLPTNKPAVDGAEIILTINAGMQRIVETELERAMRETRAPSGSIIVMDPKTGAILALAVYPTADLNLYSVPGVRERLSNRTVSAQYEPGSVFKVVTLSAALDAGVVTPAAVFEDNGVIRIGVTDIWNHDKIAPGRVMLVDVMRYSLNVEAAKMSIALGAERFYQYVRDFGYGALTHVELAGEVAGNVKSVGDGQWREIDLGTNAFGQGIAVTPLQMTAAVAAVANQGKLMRPYIIQEVRYNDRTQKTAPQIVRQVIRPETAQTVTRILAESIVAESTNKAVVPGYRIAGKTGTAQIPVAGTFDPRWTIASFVGYLPADDPRFVILVKLDKPQTSEWGSQVASPVFAAVAKQLVALAGVPPDTVRLASR
jgi:cell division protein FtsI/penicillin-binding protein 2